MADIVQSVVDPTTGRRVRFTSRGPLSQEEIDAQLALTARRLSQDSTSILYPDQGLRVEIGSPSGQMIAEPRARLATTLDDAPSNLPTISQAPRPSAGGFLGELGGRVYSLSQEALRNLAPEPIAPARDSRDWLSRVAPLSTYNLLRGIVTAPVTVPATLASAALEGLAARGEIGRLSRTQGADAAERYRREINRAQGREALGALPFGQELGDAVYGGTPNGSVPEAARRFASGVVNRARTDPAGLAMDALPALGGAVVGASRAARRVGGVQAPRSVFSSASRGGGVSLAAPAAGAPRPSSPGGVVRSVFAPMLDPANWSVTPAMGAMGGMVPRYRPRRVTDFPGPDVETMVAKAGPETLPMIRPEQLYDAAGNPKRAVLTEADRERVGYYVPRHGRESPLWGQIFLRGGVFGPLQPEYQGRVGWMTRGAGKAELLTQRIGEQGALLVPFLNKRNNAFGNPKFLQTYLQEVAAAVSLGEIKQNQVRAAVLAARRNVESLRDAKVQTIADIHALAKTMPFEHIRPTIRIMGDLNRSLDRKQNPEFKLVDPYEVLDGYNDPALDALDDFSMVGAIDMVGGVPHMSPEAMSRLYRTTIPGHDAYGIYHAGQWAGSLPPGILATEFIPRIAPHLKANKKSGVVRTSTMGLFARRAVPYIETPEGQMLLGPDAINQRVRDFENEAIYRNDTSGARRADGGRSAGLDGRAGGGLSTGDGFATGENGGASGGAGAGAGGGGLVSPAGRGGATTGGASGGNFPDLNANLFALGVVNPKLVETARELYRTRNSDFRPGLHSFSSPLSINDGAGATIRPGSYERIAGSAGKQASDIFRDLQTAIDAGESPGRSLDRAKERLGAVKASMGAQYPGLVEELDRHIAAIETDLTYQQVKRAGDKKLTPDEREAAREKLGNFDPSFKPYEKDAGKVVAWASGGKLEPYAAEFWLRSQVDRIAAVNNLLRLRYNLKSSAINLLQPLESLWPRISTADYARVSLLSLQPKVRARLKELGVLDSGTKLEQAVSAPLDRELAREIADDPDLMALAREVEADFAIKETLGFDIPKAPEPVKVEKSTKEKLAEWSPFGAASGVNRAVGYLYGELDARRRGITEPDQIHQNGLAWAEIVEFDNSTYNAPPIMRDTAQRLLMQYKGFQFKSIENLADLVNAPGTPAEKAARVAKWTTAKGTTGGVKVLVGPMGAAGLAAYVAARDMLKARGISEEDAQKGAELVYFGLPSLVGADISSSVSFLDAPFGETTQEQAINFMAGPTISTGLNLAQMIRDDKPIRDIAGRISPYVKQGGALADAIRGRNEPVSTPTGKRPPTTGETVLRTLATPLSAQSASYADREVLDTLRAEATGLIMDYAERVNPSKTASDAKSLRYKIEQKLKRIRDPKTLREIIELEKARSKQVGGSFGLGGRLSSGG